MKLDKEEKTIRSVEITNSYMTEMFSPELNDRRCDLKITFEDGSINYKNMSENEAKEQYGKYLNKEAATKSPVSVAKKGIFGQSSMQVIDHDDSGAVSNFSNSNK